MPNSTRVSCSVSAAVGSSRIRMRQSRVSALAISTSCCWEIERVPTRTVGSIGLSCASASRALAKRSGIVHQPFPAPVDLGHEDVLRHRHVRAEGDLLVDEADAEFLGAGRRADLDRLPLIRISPLSGRRMPSMMFISVDLPAPFSPAMACTSPRRSSKSTPRSAWIAPNDLLTLLILRTISSDSDRAAPWRRRLPGRGCPPRYAAGVPLCCLRRSRTNGLPCRR